MTGAALSAAACERIQGEYKLLIRWLGSAWTRAGGAGRTRAWHRPTPKLLVLQFMKQLWQQITADALAAASKQLRLGRRRHLPPASSPWGIQPSAAALGLVQPQQLPACNG